MCSRFFFCFRLSFEYQIVELLQSVSSSYSFNDDLFQIKFISQIMHEKMKNYWKIKYFIFRENCL